VSDDVYAQVMGALGQVAAPDSTGKKNKDPMVWIGSRPKNYAGGQAVVDREVMSADMMQQKVLSAGARRDPGYYSLANQLLKSNFLTASSARYPGGVASGLGNAINVYQAYQADGGKMNFPQWLDWFSGTAEGEDRSGRGRRRGGGAYMGPVESVTVQAESDVRATADAVAMEMLGRGVSDAEFKRILNRTRKAEQAQPQVTTPMGPGRQVTEQGLSTEGRQDIVQNIIAKKPEYQEFQKATTLMSWFDRALQERMQ
jgi:hypothetical protein